MNDIGQGFKASRGMRAATLDRLVDCEFFGDLGSIPVRRTKRIGSSYALGIQVACSRLHVSPACGDMSNNLHFSKMDRPISADTGCLIQVEEFSSSNFHGKDVRIHWRVPQTSPQKAFCKKVSRM
jgi:hypothetical protein